MSRATPVVAADSVPSPVRAAAAGRRLPALPVVELSVAVAPLAAPFVPGERTELVTLTTNVLILSTLAISFDLCWVHSGILGFDQALLFASRATWWPWSDGIWTSARSGPRCPWRCWSGSPCCSGCSCCAGSERKTLAIGRALLGRPRLLVLDEPTGGVWIGVIEEIAIRLERLCQHMAVPLVEQHIELAPKVARCAYVIDRGAVATEGTAQEVRGDERPFRHLAP